MMDATPKRRNRQRNPKKKSEQQQRRFELDSYSCSSSESGGVSSPSRNLPLHLQLNNRSEGYGSPSHAQNDSSSTGSPARIRTKIRDTGDPTTPTPTTTIGHIRSPRTKQQEGKISRPRRRGHRSSSNLNMSSLLGGSNHNAMYNRMHRVGSVPSIGRSDGSIASIDSTSDQSRLSRYTTASKNSVTHGTATNLLLSRRGASSNSLHVSSGNQQHSYSSNSLFGSMGGSTYSKTAGIAPSAPQSSGNSNQQKPDTYEYYHKHHHHPHPPYHESYTTMPLSSPSSLPPLPSLRVIASELSLICSLYCRYGIRSIKRKKLGRRLLYVALFLVVVVLGLVAWLCYDFYADALDVCMPPPSSRPLPSDFATFLASTEGRPYTNSSGISNDSDDYPPRPLVEYYVHGRGIGHYARSVAIVEQLNRAGVDVRMFLTRASMWRAMHEDLKIVVDTDVDPHRQHLEEGQNPLRPFVKRGETTAIAITSLTPDQGFFNSFSHALERISGDCEISASSGRYPQLVVSDGDFPGMIRAELGGIPSVGIAHGQLFSIAQKPKWVQESAQLNAAWNKQGRLNHVSSYFTEWQIATHFCFLESRYHSGTVARAPLRPEVLQMAEARKLARMGNVPPDSNGEKHPNKFATSRNAYNVPRLPQAERIQELLFATEKTSVTAAASNNTSTNADTMHRKLVICYFRDHNGEHIVQGLLDANFDVLLFDTGYTKDMANNPYRYGAKWIVEDRLRDQERKKYIPNENETDTDANHLRRRKLRLSENARHTTSPNNDYGHKGTRNNSTLTIEGRGFEVHRSQKDGPKLIRVMDRSLFVPLMHVADGVASSAGSQLMSECIYSHMPLLATYKEDDSEQRLNVELSHHIDAPCHRPLVFGNSFESLTLALQMNGNSGTAVIHEASVSHSDTSPVLESFKGFVREVRSSSVSDTYFRNANVEIAKKDRDKSYKNTEQEDFDSILAEEDPFRGLPDAAAIILEIVKQVVQKG